MIRYIALTSVLALTAGMASAEMNFNRIASFPVASNMGDTEDPSRPSSSEIIDASDDGMVLIYTDSPLGAVGMIDIADPAAPKPLGTLDMGGEPTSVGVIGMTGYVGVNTSESFTNPSGKLVVVDMAARRQVAECDLGGQPDSVAVARDGSFVAVAIENERDEDAGDGRIGQMPAGYLVLVDATPGGLACDSLKKVGLTGIRGAVTPEDPEPEFVDINSRGEVVVTLQENNAAAIVSKTGALLAAFPLGTVDLHGIDTEEEGAITLDASLSGVPREPDAVKWLDDDHFAIANEGDMDGGTRGWSIFSRDGTLVYDSGLSFEYAAIEIGHYPEKRSGNKGVEPESVTTGTFGGTPMIFVGAERASVVAVYDATDPAQPVLRQMLPSGIGPEGYVTIPERNLLISANEEDLGEDGGARSHVMIYQYQQAPAAYPQITSAGLARDGKPVGWGALSGLVADGDRLHAVTDGFYAMAPQILTIDPSGHPARITGATLVTRNGKPAEKLDMEGITLDGAGGYWIASEGRTDKEIPHQLLHVGADGAILEEVMLPQELLTQENRYGMEGVTRIGDTLWMAMQREWSDDAPNQVKLLAYNTASRQWGAVAYEKAAADQGWTGLSEITAHGDYVYVLERDNQLGQAAKVKKVYRIALSQMTPAPLGGELPVVDRQEVRDLIPDLLAGGGFVPEKVEGLAIMEDGTAWIVTDNDGVDDSSGETMFFSPGKF